MRPGHSSSGAIEEKIDSNTSDLPISDCDATINQNRNKKMRVLKASDSFGAWQSS